MNDEHPTPPTEPLADGPPPPRIRYDAPHAEPRPPMFVRLEGDSPRDDQP